MLTITPPPALEFTFVLIMRFRFCEFDPFLQTIWVPLKDTTGLQYIPNPSSFVSSTVLMGAHYGLQVECEPLTTSLWAQNTSQFSTLAVVHPSRVYPKQDTRIMLHQAALVYYTHPQTEPLYAASVVKLLIHQASSLHWTPCLLIVGNQQPGKKSEKMCLSKLQLLLLPGVRNRLHDYYVLFTHTRVLAYFINEDIPFHQDPEHFWHLPTTLNFLSDLADF